jgi:Ni,Fe-hydrogenase I large subunit
LWEALQGALGHWNRIQGGRLANYQVITPTCWTISPRDGRGILGPIEQALIDTPVADPKQPLESLRVAHSFDPCLACTVHLIDPQTNDRASAPGHGWPAPYQSLQAASSGSS